MNLILCDDIANRGDEIPWYTPLKNALAHDSSVRALDDQLFGDLSRAAAGVVVDSALLKV